MNEQQSVLLGFILGMVTMLAMLVIAEPAWVDTARKAKIECEENIPRKETCVIIALPKSKD